jgi:hypothetical protein
MNAILYIMRKSIKNRLRELIKKPGKLVLYILIIATCLGIILISALTVGYVESPAPLFWLTGILFAFVTLFLIIYLVNGLSGGDAIFEMSDVNLLFVSPVNPRKVLLYGLIRMAKTAFLVCFFVPFQAGTLANFGINYSGVMLIFAGFLLSIITMTTVSLLIYSVTNGNAVRKRIVKCIAALIFLPLIIFLAVQYFTTGDILAALETAVNSPFLSLVPVAGWTTGGVTAFLSGEVITGFLFFGLNLLLCAGMIAYILLSNPDYYEDVLVATETAYEKKRAMTEGNLNTATLLRKSVKVTKTGIPGSGATSIFGKHIRESFRENRLGLLNLPSAFIVAGAIIATFFMRDISIILQILMWIQIMFIGTGRGLKETYSHYIYLIPESSFSKIVWSNVEIVARTLLESVLIFGVGGAIASAHFTLILVCILTYTLFSLLLLGINYLSMRFLGANIGYGLLIFIYYIAVVIIMAPGLVAAIAIGVIIGGKVGFSIGLLILSGWELAAGLGCFALSRDVLHNCDMAQLKISK